MQTSRPAARGRDGSCQYACFGNTSAGNLKATTASGLPFVASPTQRLSARLGAGRLGPTPSQGSATATSRMARRPRDSASRSGRAFYGSRRGRLVRLVVRPRRRHRRSEDRTCGRRRQDGNDRSPADVLRPAGCGRVRLASAELGCVTSTGTSASSSFTAPAPSVVVEYLPAGSSTYVALPVTANLTTIVVGPDSSSPLRLSDYLAAVPVRGTTSTVAQASGRRGDAKLPTALRLTTAPTRCSRVGYLILTQQSCSSSVCCLARVRTTDDHSDLRAALRRRLHVDRASRGHGGVSPCSAAC
jgi:hypothetical protein